MATYYVDFIGGSDAADGLSYANRWKSLTLGATAARIAPGDTIRIMASPDPTSVGVNATWTANSNTVTLASAVNQTISDCETAWTAATNVTATAVTSSKAGTNRASIVSNGSFTTGKMAHFATGTLDLSGYKQVSFWINSNSAIAAGQYSLRLCSDTAGVTTVNTIAVPAQSAGFTWCPFTVDTAAALGSSIKSIALYADTSSASKTVYLDCIIACKDSTAADSLSLNSLIGKVHNLSWTASTTYAVGNIRKPTQTNRNGLRYIVTAQTGATSATEPTWPTEIGATVVDGGVTWQCEGNEDTWYCVSGIAGTAITLDQGPSSTATQYTGYGGATETVALYKREPLLYTALPGSGSTDQSVTDAGAVDNPITYSGGWNRTDMSTQTGETWVSHQRGTGYGIYNQRDHINFSNVSVVRADIGLYMSATNAYFSNVSNCSFNHNASGGIVTPTRSKFVGVTANNNAAVGMVTVSSAYVNDGWAQVTANSNYGAGINFGSSNAGAGVATASPLMNITAKYNAGSANLEVAGSGQYVITNFISAGPFAAGVRAYAGAQVHMFNPNCSGGTPFDAVAYPMNSTIYVQKNGGVADAHLISFDRGTIISATDQRNTASGISWKFRPTSTNCGAEYPMRLSVAKVALAANVPVTFKIYTRRDSTDIKGQLRLKPGQIAGAGKEVIVSCQPTINTWTQSSALTITPTEAGVVELVFEVWDGVGTTNNFWIDDFSVT